MKVIVHVVGGDVLVQLSASEFELAKAAIEMQAMLDQEEEDAQEAARVPGQDEWSVGYTLGKEMGIIDSTVFARMNAKRGRSSDWVSGFDSGVKVGASIRKGLQDV